MYFMSLDLPHAHRKNAILITRKKTVVPFDVKHRQYLLYHDALDLEVKLRNGLEQFI